MLSRSMTPLMLMIAAFCHSIEETSSISIDRPTILSHNSKYVSCLRQDEYNSSRLFVCTYTSLEVYNLDTETYSLVAGTPARSFGYQEGHEAQARFSVIYDVIQLNESTLVVSDHFNHCLRTVTGSRTAPLAGKCTEHGYLDGPGGSTALFNGPRGLALAPSGLDLYIADTFNFAFRKMELRMGEVSTLAQGLAEFIFGIPQYITCDQNTGCEKLYASAAHGGLLEVNVTSGQVTTLLDSVNGPPDGAEPFPISPTELLYGSSDLTLYNIEGGTGKVVLSLNIEVTAMSCARGTLYLWAFNRGMYQANLHGLTSNSICY